jgi:glycosyltransferase involved in cell wall biosynthesis
VTALIVRHFGPDPGTIGGMATAIGLLVEHDVGGDVVDFHATWIPDSSPRAAASLVASSARALMRMRPGQVAHVHFSERGSFLREGALLELAQRRGLVAVASIHGATFVSFARYRPQLVSRVLNRADLVTCLERRALDCVRGLAPSVPARIVPNPVVVDRGSPLSPADATEELVVFAGEIGLRKGADVLCRAWRFVAQQRLGARCLMIGPIGNFAPPDLERLDVRRGTNPVEMRRILQRARVVALPSRAEAMPMILTEAMSCGRPFVGTPVGGVPELARAGGILVPVNDEFALAEGLVELLDSPGRARTIGERGRQFCAETRSVEVVDRLLRDLYSATKARPYRRAER